MSEELESLARQRASETGEPYMQWLDALSEGRTLQSEAQLGERAFEQLLESCASPRQFAMMMEALDEHAKEHPKRAKGFVLLAEQVDDSPYDLAGWVLAIEYFYDWLKQNKRQAAYESMLAYLGCCVEAVTSKPIKPHLKDLLADMLDEYGYQG